MKINAREAERLLKNPDPTLQVFLVYGPDSGLVRERAELLTRHLVKDPDDPFTVTRLTEEDLKSEPSRLADSMAALSLMGDAPLVRLRLSGDMAAVGTYLASLAKGDYRAEARLVIEAGDLRKSSKLRKSAEDGPQFAAIACYADSARDLIRIAEDMFAAEKLELATDARAMLLPFLEGDRALARQEIEKLILFKGLASQRSEVPATIDRDDIAAISAAGADAALDQILDPTFLGQPGPTDRAYNRALEAGLNAVGLLRMLQRRIDQFDTFHASGGDASALARAGAPRFGPPADAFRDAAKRWRGRRLAQARQLAFETERAVKRSGAPIEALVGALLLRLARAASAGR